MIDDKRTHMIEALLELQHPSEVQLAPNGEWVAFVKSTLNKRDQHTPFDKAIYLVNLSTRDITRLTDDHIATNDTPRWSPDGGTLAFVSNRSNYEEMQLYQLAVAGGEPEALTDLRGIVSAPQWSPDGSSIAFLYDATAEPVKRPTPDPLVMDANPPFKRVWLLDLATRAVRPITPDTHHIFEYTWSPDGTQIAVLTSTHPNPDEGWYAAQLFTVLVATGELRHLYTADVQMGRLSWSPDGHDIAFVSCVMSDEGGISGDVYVIPASGGDPRCVTPAIPHSIMWIDWRAEGILYGAREIDSTLLGWIDPAAAQWRVITKGLFTFGDSTNQRVKAANNGTFATMRESFTEPPNVYIGSLTTDEWTPLTSDQSPLPSLRVESKHWIGRDGLPVQGYLVYPPNYVAGKRYPLFAHVHGGPSWSYSPRYGSAWERLLTSLGCLVLMPNPRGSWGRGSAYQSANVGDLGGGDWRDINAGIDCMIDEGYADPDRLAIGGWSYGGYLTTWAVTQTTRFRCAIAGASITNYESNYGVVPNREWQTALFGSNVYDDIDLHRSRSPMTHIKQVKTPTLLVHGERDIQAPPQQSIEFYTALKYLGIPTQLVIYPREPHGFLERAHQRDLYERIIGWVDKYLLG